MIELIQKTYYSMVSYRIRLYIYTIRHPKKYKKFRAIYSKHQCIFVHITKTAGTSVAKSILDFHPKHITALDFKIIFGSRKFKQYFKFAFTRNPWDRLYSAYRYLQSGGWHERDRQWYEDNISHYKDFNDFIENWLTTDNINKHIHFKPQYEFICDDKGDLLIDYLGYFETVAEDFKYIVSRLNIEAELGHHNANIQKDYRLAYNEKTRNIVGQIYKKDIELFGYEFTGIKKRLTIQSNQR